MDELDEITFDVDKKVEKDKESNEAESELEPSLSKRKIYTDQGNLEIRSLHAKNIEGDLILQPEFQRGFVWDSIRCSRL
jgi:hypothetical protein